MVGPLASRLEAHHSVKLEEMVMDPAAKSGTVILSMHFVFGCLIVIEECFSTITLHVAKFAGLLLAKNPNAFWQA